MKQTQAQRLSRTCRTSCILAAGLIVAAAGAAKEEAGINRFFLQYAVVQHSLMADRGRFDDLMNLAEFDPQAADFIGEFWRIKAIKECGDFIERTASVHSKRVGTKTTEGERKAILDQAAEQADQCFYDVYYRNWDAINEMIVARLQAASSPTTDAENPPPSPTAQQREGAAPDPQETDTSSSAVQRSPTWRWWFADIDFWKGVTILVGMFAVYVAYQQLRTARAKFKLDLFEKRFQVFAGTRKFLSMILQKANVDLGALFDYRAAIGEASFLFGNHLTDYLAEIDRRALHLHTLHETMEPLPRGDERSRLANEISEELKWLIDQLPELKKRFGPYMRFGVWK